MKGEILMSEQQLDKSDIEDAEEIFSEAYDRLCSAREVFKQTEKMAEDCLAWANPTLELIKQGRSGLDGSTMMKAEMGINMVKADYDHARNSMKAAEQRAVNCASIIRRLEVYLKTPTLQEDKLNYAEKFESELLYLRASVQEVRVLHAQLEGAVAALEQLLQEAGAALAQRMLQP